MTSYPIVVYIAEEDVDALQQITWARGYGRPAEMIKAMVADTIATGVPDDPIMTLYSQGLSDSEIGARLGLTNLTVSTHRRARGFAAHRRRRRGEAA